MKTQGTSFFSLFLFSCNSILKKNIGKVYTCKKDTKNCTRGILSGKGVKALCVITFNWE